MAKKSKGFSELLKQQQRGGADAQQRSLNKLEKQVKKSSLGQQFETVVSNPPGAARMSDVLDDFVAPYEAEGMSLAQLNNMYGLAVVAWNLAIAPKEKRQSMKADFLKKAQKISDPSIEQEMFAFLDEMISRKQQHFADNKRYIINFQLEDLGNEFHLSVASTLDQ